VAGTSEEKMNAYFESTVKDIMWIGAYVPCCKGSPTSGAGLGMKLKEWFITKRVPVIATGVEKDRAAKFDPVHWVWTVWIPDRVARSQLNSSHVGVILMGDLKEFKAHKSTSTGG
jgi:hypothetical protein